MLINCWTEILRELFERRLKSPLLLEMVNVVYSFYLNECPYDIETILIDSYFYFFRNGFNRQQQMRLQRKVKIKGYTLRFGHKTKYFAAFYGAFRAFIFLSIHLFGNDIMPICIFN